MKLKLAQFSTIVLFALVMGVFWGTWFALSRSIVTFRAQTFLDIGQTAIRNLAVPMRMMMPLALLSAALPLISTTWSIGESAGSHRNQSGNRQEGAECVIRLPAVTQRFPIGREACGRPYFDLIIDRDFNSQSHYQGANHQHKAGECLGTIHQGDSI
jgi:hypothetical protein